MKVGNVVLHGARTAEYHDLKRVDDVTYLIGRAVGLVQFTGDISVRRITQHSLPKSSILCAGYLHASPSDSVLAATYFLERFCFPDVFLTIYFYSSC